jgi:hypothetical protein
LVEIVNQTHVEFESTPTVPEEVHNIQHDQIALSNIPNLTDSKDQIHDLAYGSLGKTFLEVGQVVNMLQTFSS